MLFARQGHWQLSGLAGCGLPQLTYNGPEPEPCWAKRASLAQPATLPASHAGKQQRCPRRNNARNVMPCASDFLMVLMIHVTHFKHQNSKSLGSGIRLQTHRGRFCADTRRLTALQASYALYMYTRTTWSSRVSFLQRVWQT